MSDAVIKDNIRWCIDTDGTTIVILDRFKRQYKLFFPFVLTTEQIFEVANDFAKSVVLQTWIDIYDYF